ncbi:early nodulin-like protein 9 [Ziziphus jujuba]|uniref:Early nodulin-like protein 9 n=1 Tax=Ziziphus jujuba TaxID=326968 RepID=A0ABM3I7S7_ZIZJJ|nr:early nodulin-like protein 9 [Ziziphus jujuba]
MAHTILTSNCQNKPICLLGLLVLTLSVMQTSDATDPIPVGKTGIWSPNSTNYIQWAEETTFTIGDSIAFHFTAGKDSVLQVQQGDYTNCITGSPIYAFPNDTGYNVAMFNYSGTCYFISGIKDHCLKNQKFRVLVRANTNENPSPPPPNGASAIFLSFIGYLGAFAASSLLLAF